MDEPRWLNDVQQQAWQGLLVFVHRALPELERTMKEHDVLAVHYSIMSALSDAPDRSLRLSELADMSNVSQSRLTHRMRTLTDREFIDIHPCPEDGRAKNATLTDAGFDHLKALAPLHVADVQRLVFDHLDPDETQALADILTKVATNFCDHEQFQAEPAEA